MYIDSAALHTAKPCHLPLGKLVYSYLQEPERILERTYANDVFCHIFIFETVIDEVGGWYARVEKTSYLVSHTLVKAGLQSSGDTCPALLHVNLQSDH